MQITMALTALMISGGFVFWVAVMSWIIAGADKAPWMQATAMIVFALAAIAFAFVAGRVWP